MASPAVAAGKGDGAGTFPLLPTAVGFGVAGNRGTGRGWSGRSPPVSLHNAVTRVWVALKAPVTETNQDISPALLSVLICARN